MKIIKGGSDSNIEPYSIEQFSTVELGEHSYRLTSFGNEKSVQENALAAKTRAGGVTVVSSPPPRRKSLFSSYDDDTDTGVFDAYTGRSHPGGESGESSESKDDESQKLLERIFSQDLTQDEETPPAQPSDGDFQNFSFNKEAPENLNLVASQKELAEKISEISELEKQKNEFLQMIEELNVQNERLTAEKTELEVKIAEIPELCEKAKEEGRDAAKKEYDRVQRALYEADKADYLQKMEENWREAVKEIQKVDEKISEIDKDMPEIILSYVKEIVGAERKLNDGIIVNVVRQALRHLTDLQQMIFNVNSADAQIIAEKFPQYGVSIDASVPKGSVKVRTKIGEVSLSIDNWMENLQKQIDEQLAAAKENQAQE
jgi:flagellar biosynthesis/type III secretory pathway protein FliH